MENYKEFLVFPLDYKNKIVFSSTEKAENTFIIDVDWNFPLNNAKPKMFLEVNNNGEEEKERKQEEKEEKTLHEIAVSESKNLLAYTASDKSIFVSRINGSSVEVLSRRVFPRTESCILFSKSGNLYLSDKTGDVFEFSCDSENINARGKWILGHISQILDIQLSSNYILTCDRDEKIRVTNISKPSLEIESICLGHREFVSALAIISDELHHLLLSISGDETLKLWNFVSGKELSSISLQYVPISFKVIVNSSNEGTLCMSSKENVVYLYSYNVDDSNVLKINELGSKDFKSDISISVLNEKFYTKYVNINELFIDRINIIDNAANFESIKTNIPKEVEVKTFKSFEVPSLFKNNSFDNVKAYIDRKKARIEKSNKK